LSRKIRRFTMHFRIRTKLLIAFFGIIFPFLIIVDIITVYNANNLRNSALEAEAISEEMHSVMSLQLAVDRALMPGNDYIITGDRKYIDEFNDASREVEELMKKVEETLVVLKGMDTPEVREKTEIFKSVRTAWQNIKEMSSKIFAIQDPVGNKDAARLMEEMDYKWAYPAIENLDKHHEIDRKEREEAIEGVRRAWRWSWVIMISGSVLLMAIGASFAAFYSRLFTRPIEAIHDRADAIAKGEFKGTLNIKTGDELEHLANAVNEMAAQLDSFYGTLERQVEERTKELKESEEFSRRVIESSDDCIKVLDLEGNLLSMSAGGQEAMEIDDITPYLNRSWVDFWKGKDREAAMEAISKAKKGKAGMFSGYCETAKGKPKWWEIVITPIKDANGSICRLLSVSRDITERKKAEEKLRQHVDELERFQKVAVKREFRIKELTDEVERLKERIGEMEKK
jgi:PAS domain S-box-containing protein